MTARGIATSCLLAAGGILTACAVSGPGYYGDGYAGVDYGYVGDYWEPWGYDYGGWGGRYWVGPPHGRWHDDGDHAGHFGGEGRPGGEGHFGGEGHPGGGGHFGGGGGRPAPSIPGRHR